MTRTYFKLAQRPDSGGVTELTRLVSSLLGNIEAGGERTVRAATDLVSHAEHGPDSAVWLATTSPELATEVRRIAPRYARMAEIIRGSLRITIENGGHE